MMNMDSSTPSVLNSTPRQSPDVFSLRLTNVPLSPVSLARMPTLGLYPKDKDSCSMSSQKPES